MERAPGKRRIKRPANLELIDFDSDSSSDSDFNIEDHYVNSELDSGDSCFSLSDGMFKKNLFNVIFIVLIQCTFLNIYIYKYTYIFQKMMEIKKKLKNMMVITKKLKKMMVIKKKLKNTMKKLKMIINVRMIV